MFDELEILPRLKFRRQFLLGPRDFTPNEHWSCIHLPGELYLSIHNDLPYAMTSDNGRTITMIGRVINPYHPNSEESDILSSIMVNAKDFKSFLDCTNILVGRWLIIYQDDGGTYLFTDPFGFRPIYYMSESNGEKICASQPELIKSFQPLELSDDKELYQFLVDHRHINKESLWLGKKTIYKNCLHLMPNHYLDFDKAEQVRFYPSRPLKKKNINEVIDISCEIFQGTMTALSQRYDISLALTSGMDSRLLLAASKHVKDDIEYFVYYQNNFSDEHPDIWVPQKLAQQFDLNFMIRKTSFKELPGWFASILSNNVTCARFLPKTGNIFHSLIDGEKKITISGNGGGVYKTVFNFVEGESVTTDGILLRIFGGGSAPPIFAVREVEDWKNSLNISSLGNYHILDLLYWEQRLGNWGAHFASEQDIAVEEISPFNCRLLIDTFLSSRRSLRSVNEHKIYSELIRRMWPELLFFPINPPPKRNYLSILKRTLRPYVPSSIVSGLKRCLRV
jgi:hypothetical protein